MPGSSARVRPDDDRRGAEERAHVGHPADQERHAVAEGGAREDHRAAVLVEAPPERREGERRGQEREAGEREDRHGAEARRARRDRGGHEEDADADDPVDAERQQLQRADGARGAFGRAGHAAAS